MTSDHGGGRDVYLKKGQDIIGLHSVCELTETGWHQIDGWCNAYSDQFHCLGSVYTFQHTLEEEVTERRQNGWVEIEGPSETKWFEE